jgi:hypothetical protein
MKLKNILNELFEYKDLEQKFKAELDQLNSSHNISINMGMYDPRNDRPDTDPLKGKGYGKITFVGNSEVMDGSFEKALDWAKKKGFEITQVSDFYDYEPGERRYYPHIKFHFNVEDVPPTNS